MTHRTILGDVVEAYAECKARHEQYRGRGQHDRADDYLDEMKLIERSITLVETNTTWRRVIAERRAREATR